MVREDSVDRFPSYLFLKGHSWAGVKRTPGQLF